MPKFKVTLSARGNPDFRQGETLPGVRPRVAVVETLREASEKCRAYIEEHDLGGGNWSGGQVYAVESGAHVAQISYNGRAWKPGREMVPIPFESEE